MAALKALPTGEISPVTPSAGISGKVLRADTDDPIPGLVVRLLKGQAEVAKCETGPAGEFTFTGLAAGAYDLAIAPWGLVRQAVTAVTGPAQPLTLRLVGGQTSVLSGAVLSPTSAPVAGVEVTLHRDAAVVARATSAADGSFRFERLTLGRYRLSVPGITVDGIALDGWQAKSLKLTTGVAASYKYVPSTRLLPAEETNNRRLFYGLVTDALGAPLNGVKVQMSWAGAGADTVFPVRASGSDPYKPAGYFEFLHTPGTFTLQIVGADWPADPAAGLETANVPGREGQPVTYEVNFKLQAAGGAAQVDGVIAGGAQGRKVTLTRKASSPPAAREAALAAGGAFAFPNVAAGAYELALEGVGVIASDIAITSGALFKVLFALNSRLSGKVVGPPEGLVAVLYSPPSWGWTRQVPLASDGSFLFDNLPAGRYRLEVGGQVLSDLALTGENKLVLAPIELAAGRRSVIRGRVADASGQPKADRAVTLKRDGVFVAETRTAADGTYRFANLPAGVYSVEVAGLGRRQERSDP